MLANRPKKFSASIDCDTLLIPACRQAGHCQPERIFPAVRSRQEQEKKVREPWPRQLRGAFLNAYVSFRV